MKSLCAPAALAAAFFYCALPAAGGGPNLQVESTVPLRHRMAPAATPVSVTFDRPVLTSSFNGATFYAFGRVSGLHTSAIEFSNNNRTVTLRPQRRFVAGETVLVVLTNGLRGADNSPLRSAGYSFTFLIRTKPATMTFSQIASMSNRSSVSTPTRIYGAAAGDFNGDTWTDLCTVNETSEDLRMFLNRADGTGLYDGPIVPFTPIGAQASPNDTADFNMDGRLDLCVGNTYGNSVSVVLGGGDGSFGPQAELPVGNTPYGVASFDMDGDGDMDIACSASNGNNVYILRNSGNGTFAPATAYNAGGGEYGLACGDMNNDGIMDLIVGENSTDRISIHLGNGNATFTASAAVNCGGAVWIVVVGDLNGDGNLDVSTANSFNNNAGILLGNGLGGLAPVTTYPTLGHTPSNDLGDLDGDGDLDWVISSFGGERWRLYRNNGNGVFTFVRDFTADSNPSCAVLVDIDKDHDLDMVLTDEVADTVKLLQNDGVTPMGDVNCSGAIDFFDIDPFLTALFDPASFVTRYPGCWMGQADANESGQVDFFDIDPFLVLLFD